MKKPNIKPLGENVLILPERDEQKTAAGIFLPDTAREERPQQGRVMAIGESEKIKVSVNQKVIFNRYGGTEVKIGSEEYLLVASKDILRSVDYTAAFRHVQAHFPKLRDFEDVLQGCVKAGLIVPHHDVRAGRVTLTAGPHA